MQSRASKAWSCPRCARLRHAACPGRSRGHVLLCGLECLQPQSGLQAGPILQGRQGSLPTAHRSAPSLQGALLSRVTGPCLRTHQLSMCKRSWRVHKASWGADRKTHSCRELSVAPDAGRYAKAAAWPPKQTFLRSLICGVQPGAQLLTCTAAGRCARPQAAWCHVAVHAMLVMHTAWPC